jgi:hypothetical protein
MQATDPRGALLIQYANDPKFFWRVYKGCQMDIHSAQKKASSSVLPEREVRADIATAIKLGVLRAWMYRFLQSKGINPTQYFESQRRNRDDDYIKVKTAFADFEDFSPSTPITSDEVFEATREEVYRVFKGPGTDAHQSGFTGGKLRDGIARAVEWTDSEENFEWSEGPPVGNKAFVLPNDDPFGPVILRVAAHFVTVFGLIPTTYWVFEKMFCPGEYATLLRAFGADETTDPAAFKAMQVDLGRKLKEMDEEMATMADNGDLRNYYDSIGEEE